MVGLAAFVEGWRADGAIGWGARTSGEGARTAFDCMAML
jgi:hypothetical protein